MSAQVMKVLNSILHDQWPNQRMLGEFLFRKLRTVKRLERVIDEIKRSADDSPLRDSISCGLGCRNSWLKKARMPMQGLLNNPWKAQRDQQTARRQKLRAYRPKLRLCQKKLMLSHLRKENQKAGKAIECGRKGQDAMYLPSDAIRLCAWCQVCLQSFEGSTSKTKS